MRLSWRYWLTSISVLVVVVLVVDQVMVVVVVTGYIHQPGIDVLPAGYGDGDGI